MMNLFSLGIVLASLVTGAVWSPSPSPPAPPHHDQSDVIVKEGHRVVVVEFDKEGEGNTKVLISPHERLSGVDIKEGNHHPAADDEKLSGPRELVCDAFGKCTQKIASAFGMTKDKVSEKAHDMQQHAKGTVGGYEERAKEAVRTAGVGAEEKGKSMGTKVGESLSKAKDTLAQGMGKAKKVADDAKDVIKDSAVKTAEFDMVDSPKRMGEDIVRNVSRKVEKGAENVAEQAKETASNVKEEGKKSLREIGSKVREATYDVLEYMVLPLPEKVDAVVGLIHMLGFSTAYGMCVWVTFVSSYVLGRYLPRQQFGMVQSKIYPVYFRAMAYCVGAALLGHLVSQRKGILSSLMEMFQGLSLLSALLMVLTNMTYLEPRATKLMFERTKVEKEDGRGIPGAARHGIADHGGDTVARPCANVVAERQDVLTMNERLKKLNTYSSALNVSTLVVLTWHMAYMGRRLQATR